MSRSTPQVLRFNRHSEDDSEPSGSLAVFHEIDYVVYVFQFAKSGHVWFDVVFMTELDRFPHSLRNAAAGALYPVLSKKNVKSVHRQICSGYANNHQQPVCPILLSVPEPSFLIRIRT